LVQKSSRINVYNALALPALLYKSETWTVNENDKKKLLTSFEMKFLRRAAKYTRVDQKNNLQIMVDVKADPAEEKLRRCKSNWLNI
jgi:hypothetical protein